MTAQLDIIPFRGDDIHLTMIDGKPLVVARTIFENLRVDADRQIAKLQKQPWACTSVTAVQVGDQRRNMIVADVRTILMALATISASRVKPEARDTLIAYQNEIADVIEAYVIKGAVINPRVTEEQLPAVIDTAVRDYRTEREILANEAEAQLSLIYTAKKFGFIDSSHADTKAQVRLARGLGEVPAVPQEELPLYVEDFMKSKGISKGKISAFSGAFGKKVLAQAATDGVKVPGKRPQELPSGRIQEVTAWTKEHQPLFERAWSASYANDARLMG